MLEAARVVNLPVNKQDVAQDGKQVGLKRTNDTSVDKGLFRRVDHFQFHATLAAQHVNIKAFEAGQQFFTVICQASGVQYGK